MPKGVGDKFQDSTKYERGRMEEGRFDWAHEPAPFKEYPGAPKVHLAAPQTAAGPLMWDTLMRRRSVREFEKKPLGYSDLSQLLWAAQGVTAVRYGHHFRTAPSAGALYPIETYVVANSIEGVDRGVYHYDCRAHVLDQVKTGDFRLAVAKSALDQELAYYANAVFVFTAVFMRSKWKYSQRAYRYVYLDAGHIAQNLALAAVGLGLGSCQLAAFYDQEVNELLGINNATESAVYMTVIGRPTE